MSIAAQRLTCIIHFRETRNDYGFSISISSSLQSFDVCLVNFVKFWDVVPGYFTKDSRLISGYPFLSPEGEGKKSQSKCQSNRSTGLWRNFVCTAATAMRAVTTKQWIVLIVEDAATAHG